MDYIDEKEQLHLGEDHPSPAPGRNARDIIFSAGTALSKTMLNGIDLGPHALIFAFLKVLCIHCFSVLFLCVGCLCAGWRVPQCPCRGQRKTLGVGLLLLSGNLPVAQHWVVR